MTVDALSAWRVSYFHEAPSKIVSFRPPTFRDPNTGIIQEAEGAALGMNLSGAMVKLLDHPGGTRGLLRRWERFCRQRHRGLSSHPVEGACAALLYYVIRDRLTVKTAADAVGVDVKTALGLITAATRQMSHWVTLEMRVDPAQSHDPDYCTVCRSEQAA